MITQTIAIAFPIDVKSYGCTEFELLAMNELNRRGLTEMGLNFVDSGEVLVDIDVDYVPEMIHVGSDTVTCELWSNDDSLSVAQNVGTDLNGKLIVFDEDNEIHSEYDYGAAQYHPEFDSLTEHYRLQWITAHGQDNYDRMYGDWQPGEF